ncbi:hypothetical protein [Solirhodobacter olei]|uniref:hypothetical protein n=1 Tax=Solirhodobacter olei TaxID=2493082 RepID=UPI000FDBD8AF|nr:hypothetical protein [Solirhodobacter olei]
MTITAVGQYYGGNDPDRVFVDDAIDMTATITLGRVPRHTFFVEDNFTIGSEVNDDWYGDV